jgi:hypothetical protein
VSKALEQDISSDAEWGKKKDSGLLMKTMPGSRCPNRGRAERTGTCFAHNLRSTPQLFEDMFF